MNRYTTQLWATVYSWLRATGNSIDRDYCRTELTTHPGYPSLLSLVDFLDIGGVAYKVLRIDTSYVNECSYPLLAHINDHNGERMHMISDVKEWVAQSELAAHWTGIVVCIERSSNWENDLHTLYRQENRNGKLVALTFSITAIVLLALSIIHYFNTTINAFGILSFVGLIISAALQVTEMGFQDQFQVCAVFGAGDCGQVLKNSYAERFWGFTPADLSFLYFATQFLIYVLGCWRPWLLQGNFLLSFLGVPVAVWSIYTQGVKIKRWCALCLGIVSILLLQVSISLIFHFQFQRVLPELIFIALFVLLAAILFPVKQLIKTNKNNKIKLAELRKWKIDADLFITQWEKEQVVDTTVWENDIIIGDAANPLLITMASNPYCSPCAKAHRQIDHLFQRFESSVRVQLRLFCDPGNRQDMHTIVVKDILEKTAAMHNRADVRQMLNDWFECMDYTKWTNKWPLPTHRHNDLDLEKGLIQHSQWLAQENIGSTPAIFINGKKLPKRYSVDDLPALIPRMEEYLHLSLN